MLERTLKLTLLLAIVCSPLTGCGYMTKQGRQTMAYQRYIKKCSGRKMGQVKKYKKLKMPLTPEPSENKVTAEVMNAPQSVTSGQTSPQSVSSGESSPSEQTTTSTSNPTP